MDHTTNYNLPLYTAADETNYMTNWNGAMTSIDTAVKAVDDKPMVDQTAREEATVANNGVNKLNELLSPDSISAVNGFDVAFTTLKDGLYYCYGSFNSADTTSYPYISIMNSEKTSSFALILGTPTTQSDSCKYGQLILLPAGTYVIAKAYGEPRNPTFSAVRLLDL